MSDGLIPVPADAVPRGRGTNAFSEPVTEVAAKLADNPGVWFLIGKGDKEARSRLNNAAALLSGSKYKSLTPYYKDGRFVTRVSGAKDAPHAAEFAVGVYAKYVRTGNTADEEA